MAAQRVVRSAAGVSRAEALRIGLDQRSTYTVLDFLRSEDILGPATSADAAPVKHQGPSVPLNAGHRIADMPPAFVNEDALAGAYAFCDPSGRGGEGLDGDGVTTIDSATTSTEHADRHPTTVTMVKQPVFQP